MERRSGQVGVGGGLVWDASRGVLQTPHLADPTCSWPERFQVGAEDNMALSPPQRASQLELTIPRRPGCSNASVVECTTLPLETLLAPYSSYVTRNLRLEQAHWRRNQSLRGNNFIARRAFRINGGSTGSRKRDMPRSQPSEQKSWVARGRQKRWHA